MLDGVGMNGGDTVPVPHSVTVTATAGYDIHVRLMHTMLHPSILTQFRYHPGVQAVYVQSAIKVFIHATGSTGTGAGAGAGCGVSAPDLSVVIMLLRQRLKVFMEVCTCTGVLCSVYCMYMCMYIYILCFLCCYWRVYSYLYLYTYTHIAHSGHGGAGAGGSV